MNLTIINAMNNIENDNKLYNIKTNELYITNNEKKLQTKPYFYIIKHIPSGKKYAGSRWAKGCNKNELLKEGGYLTSSSTILKYIKKDGLNSFEIVETIEMLDPYSYETKFLIENNCKKSKDWFNCHHNDRRPPTGSFEFNKTIIEKYGVEYSTKIKKVCEHCNKNISVQNYKKYHGEMCKIINKNRKVNTHLIGKKKSNLTKLFQRGIEYYNPETLKVKRIKIHLGEEIPIGWKKGRVLKEKSIWMNDGFSNFKIKENQSNSMSLIKGRIIKKDKSGRFSK